MKRFDRLSVLSLRGVASARLVSDNQCHQPAFVVQHHHEGVQRNAHVHVADWLFADEWMPPAFQGQVAYLLLPVCLQPTDACLLQVDHVLLLIVHCLLPAARSLTSAVGSLYYLLTVRC